MVLPGYHLRSQVQESAAADSRPKQQAIDKTDGKHAADMIEENIKSTGSPPRIEQEKDDQTAQNKPSESAMPIQNETSVEKEDGNISPSELSELNSSTVVEKPTESKIPAEKSNKTDDDKNQEEEIISCPICGQTFGRRSKLTEHLKTHSTDQATCPICKKILNSSNSRDRHLLIHSKDRPYKCKVCKATFTTNGNMNRHFKTHLNKKGRSPMRKKMMIGKISNEKGDNASKEQGNLSKKEELPPQADVCEGATETPEFQSEMEEMYHQKNYFNSLGLCRKSSIPQQNVNQALVSDKQGKFEELPEKRKELTIWNEGRIDQIPHTTTQTGDNLRRRKVKESTDAGSSKANSNSVKIRSDGMPNSDPTDAQDLAGITDIISNVQPKTSTENQTTTDTSPTGHQYIKHSIKQSFTCENCKYTAKDKNSLKRHKQTHNRNGKFKCKTCSLTFTNKANGQRHVRELHGLHDRESISAQIVFLKAETDSAVQKIFPCRYCSSIFDNEQALQHHIRSNECTKKPFFCAICVIGSSTKNNCFRHITNKHPEIFNNKMSSEEKKRVKKLNMRQTIYTSPQQDEDNKSKEIEAAEGLCRLSENRQDDTFTESVCATEQFHDTSCNRLADVEAPSVAVGTGTTVIVGADPVGTGPSETTGTVSSMITGTSLSMILGTCPSVTKSNSEFSEDKPLDLSVNPLDLSFKSFKKIDSLDLPESKLETARVSESQMAVSESNGHSQSTQNFGKNDNNLQQQKCVLPKQSIKNFKCKYCEKTFSSNSNLQRHLVNLHKQSSTIQLESSHNPIRRDLLRECSINSSVKHSDCNQIKNSRSSLTNSKFNASYDRGTGSDTENDLASIPSIQSTVNQGIHIAHPCTSTAYSVISHINRKRPFSDLQSSSSSFPAWNQRKKQVRTGPRSPTEAACSPVSVPQRVVTTSMDRFNDEGSIGGSPATIPGNNSSACELSKSTHDQSFNVRLAESAEPSPSKDTDLICSYCSSQFSSKEHVDSHIKELHYLEHNNTLEVPDEKIRWKKERFSKLRQ
ncbi:Ras-responsive element-binding protein 1 [Araneus ventricosus]|uniref:Ras-responsive element-binding protein 1 n=1 Tax=Araneus ventricosus TaxID=182803 RepID=A0A4Y2FR65_ARAVE|nr:Ras-responsive element-binding protein 1 [Araneus ventricosus]